MTKSLTERILNTAEFGLGAVIYTVRGALSIVKSAAFYGAIAYWLHRAATRPEHQATYGTLEDSTYIIREKIPVFMPSLESQLATPVSFEEKEKSLTEFEKKFNELRPQISEAKQTDQSLAAKKKHLELFDRLFELKGYEIAWQDEFSAIEDMRESYPDFDEYTAKYGDVTGFGKKIFEEMTARKLPKNLKFTNDPLIPNSIVRKILGCDFEGYHDFLLEEIYVDQDRVSYVSQLLTVLHELGHAAYQGQEESHYAVKGNIFSVAPMEEAAAYLSMMAGTNAIAKQFPELAEEAKIHLSKQRAKHIENYQNGSDECHDKGFTLAESIASEFGYDYAAAFNYLLSRNRMDDLSPDIIAKLDSFRKTAQPKTPELTVLKEKARNVARTYLDFRHKYGDIYARLHGEIAGEELRLELAADPEEDMIESEDKI